MTFWKKHKRKTLKEVSDDNLIFTYASELEEIGNGGNAITLLNRQTRKKLERLGIIRHAHVAHRYVLTLEGSNILLELKRSR